MFLGPPRRFCLENEDPIIAAKRIISREAGAEVCIATLLMGEFITNETTTSSWSPVVYTQVDLEKLLRSDYFDDASTNSFVLQSVASMLFWSHSSI